MECFTKEKFYIDFQLKTYFARPVKNIGGMEPIPPIE